MQPLHQALRKKLFQPPAGIAELLTPGSGLFITIVSQADLILHE